MENENPGAVQELSGVVPRTADRSFTIDNLQPDTSYNVSVTTESGMVGSLTESAPRVVTRRTSTIGECDILVVSTTTDSMMVEWGTCPGASLYYLDLDPVPAGFAQRLILSSQPREATLTALDPGTKYTVLLRISSTGEPVSTATSYTVPDVPTLTVTQGVTQLDLQWSTQPQLSSEIFLQSPGETTPSLVETVFSGVNEYTILGLLPATPYTVSVVNVVGAGDTAKRSEPTVRMRNTGTE